jgi:hypothetical protein
MINIMQTDQNRIISRLELQIGMRFSLVPRSTTLRQIISGILPDIITSKRAPFLRHLVIASAMFAEGYNANIDDSPLVFASRAAKISKSRRFSSVLIEPSTRVRTLHQVYTSAPHLSTVYLGVGT